MLRYDRFDPSDCAFPRPRVPTLPPLQRSQLGPARAAPPVPRRHFARGRYALGAAYRLVGVGPTRSLLAPAYHCRTMLDPALALGAEVVPYPLTPDLHADLDGLRRVAAACRTPPAALLLTHYFGLPREVEAVAAWCREQGIALIEDCSHALPFTGATATRPAMGATGRFAVSSPYKFFPCPDGGWLWAADANDLPAQPQPGPGAAAELRAALAAGKACLQGTGTDDRRLRIETIEAELSGFAGNPAAMGRTWVESSDQPSDEYRPQEATITGLAVSRWIERHTRLDALIERRRMRYRQWLEATDGLPEVEPLLPALPESVAPYMFPLRVREPARLFYPLKRMGLPIWRWDDMAISDCPVSRSYRQGVFHLPCHQALSDEQMRWMTTLLRTAAARC